MRIQGLPPNTIVLECVVCGDRFVIMNPIAEYEDGLCGACYLVFCDPDKEMRRMEQTVPWQTEGF